MLKGKHQHIARALAQAKLTPFGASLTDVGYATII